MCAPRQVELRSRLIESDSAGLPREGGGATTGGAAFFFEDFKFRHYLLNRSCRKHPYTA